MKKFILFLSMAVAIIFTTQISEAQKMSTTNTLSPKDASIAEIAAFTARGYIPQLKQALNKGLDNGLTVNQIKEVLVQMYAYTGFPRSLNGINAFMEVTAERSAKGIKDNDGPAAKPLPKDTDKNKYGENVRAELVGGPTKGAFQVFTPVIDDFLKEHLFADIFARDILTYREREIATVGALAALEGAGSQLGSHMGISMNTGVTREQLNEIVLMTEKNIGKKEGAAAAIVLENVLKARKK